jgi:beta-lactam-binding protein with PASTA domain
VIPDFRGLAYQDVISAQENKDYKFSVIDSVFDPGKPGGSVITQDPLPGSKVKKNRMVYLTITSMVPEKTTKPELRDLTLRQAQTMLDSAGLKLGKLNYIKSFDEDAVQNQLYKGRFIRAGTELDKGSAISLMVGMGSKAAVMEVDSIGGDSLEIGDGISN